MNQFWITLLAAVLAFMFGVILYMIKRNDEKAVRREQERQRTEALKEADRDEREMLILKGLNAVFSITKELTECVLHKKPPNGELEDALRYKQDVKHEIEDYMRRKAAR